MTSGTRKPPPISTSSPRETITSRPAASAASVSSVAAALLLTTTAASAPVSGRAAARRGRRGARASPARGRIRGWCSRASGRHALERRARERRAAEVGVEDHAGGVDDGARATGRSARRDGPGRSASSAAPTSSGAALRRHTDPQVSRRRTQRVDDAVRRTRTRAPGERALTELFDRGIDAVRRWSRFCQHYVVAGPHPATPWPTHGCQRSLARAVVRAAADCFRHIIDC